MLKVWVLAFKGPEYPFLVITILKEAGGSPLGVWPRINKPHDLNIVLPSVFSIGTNYLATRFVPVVFIALVKHRFQRSSGERNVNLGLPLSKHLRHSSNTQRNCPALLA